MSEKLFEGQAVEMRIGGIQRDAPGRGYRDPSVVLRDYQRWIDQPCPLCGANLLTHEDYTLTLAIIGAAVSLNQEWPAPEGEVERVGLHVVMDLQWAGSGHRGARWQ